jgi:hypothetical protein
MNLIIDETPTISIIDDNEIKTGNSVGKTTILKLIDVCLGEDPKVIYSDTGRGQQIYKIVQDFLTVNDVLISLFLKEDLDKNESREIVIERNFLSGRRCIRRINGVQYSREEFLSELKNIIFPGQKSEKPTFRQLISHNIRYNEDRLNHTLETLTGYGKGVEYEALYLNLLGCDFNSGPKKLELSDKIKQENIYKKRLEREQTKIAYEAALSMINDEIAELDGKKKLLRVNENFERDLNELNLVRFEINKISTEISNLELRKKLILDIQNELKGEIANIDLNQLRSIYAQAQDYIHDLQKTFEDLVDYHNKMIIEKSRFISKDIPKINDQISNHKHHLSSLLRNEMELTGVIVKSDSYEKLENIISEMGEKFRKKGEYESIIKQITEVENNIDKFSAQLDNIDIDTFSDRFQQMVKDQITKFNRIFSNVSYALYNEKYLIKYEIKYNTKSGAKFYQFSSFNSNMSSGKKQGEILCFDIAYTFFAEEEKIPCLHFLLNDKKELMHDNQLVSVDKFIQGKDIQLVVSILKDKLPEELKKEEYYVVKLSQDDKLFRIETGMKK